MEKKLFEEAKKTRLLAHSPYSQFKVGAAVLGNDGQIYGGCNIENSSYGGTVCAERVAIFNAVSKGVKKIKAVYVVTDQNPPWPPCGFCRQVISEFAESTSIPIHYGNINGDRKSKTLKDLLPEAFSPENLK